MTIVFKILAQIFSYLGFSMHFKKNKYANYQTLIKLIKKLLCFVINIFIFVGSKRDNKYKL